jgi:long-chain acyl-CoA synthetase
VVKAFVVVRDGMSVSASELDGHCTASLAPYKRPSSFEFRDQLPVSAVGKILYRVLRDEERSRGNR